MHRKSKAEKTTQKFTAKVRNRRPTGNQPGMPERFMYICIGVKTCPNEMCNFMARPTRSNVAQIRNHECPLAVEEVQSRLKWMPKKCVRNYIIRRGIIKKDN
jgi:hypothetical protein